MSTTKNGNSGIVSIHGKDYKTVALRMTEFRNEHPDYGIITFIESIDKESVIVKASIFDESGRCISSGYAEEWRVSSDINKTSMVENAETSAVGRALAFFKYAGSEIASADEIEIAKRKEKVLKEKVLKEETKSSKHWAEDTERTTKFWAYCVNNGLTLPEIQNALGFVKIKDCKHSAAKAKEIVDGLIADKKKETENAES